MAERSHQAPNELVDSPSATSQIAPPNVDQWPLTRMIRLLSVPPSCGSYHRREEVRVFVHGIVAEHRKRSPNGREFAHDETKGRLQPAIHWAFKKLISYVA